MDYLYSGSNININLGAQTAVWSCMCIFVMQTIRRKAYHQDALGRNSDARTHGT
jgi:hypothetical protein